MTPALGSLALHCAWAVFGLLGEPEENVVETLVWGRRDTEIEDDFSRLRTHEGENHPIHAESAGIVRWRMECVNITR